MQAPANRPVNRLLLRGLVKATTGIQVEEYYAATKKGGVDHGVLIESNVPEAGTKPTVGQYVQSDLRDENKQAEKYVRAKSKARVFLKAGRSVQASGTQGGLYVGTGKSFERKVKALTVILSEEKGWGWRRSLYFSSVWLLFL